MLPTSGSLEVTPGSGGYVHPDLLELAGGAFQSSLALRFDEDADPATVIATLKERYPSNVITPLAPFDVADVVRLRPVAIWLAAAIVVLGVAALLHALILTVSRRRHDLAVLAALGLPSRQLGASIGWQAATFGVIGVVLGIPLGILVGRIGFHALTDTLGVVDVAELPLGAVGAIVAGRRPRDDRGGSRTGHRRHPCSPRRPRSAPSSGPSEPALPTLPAVPLDVTTVAGHAATTWADEIVPALHDYIRIPALSPAFDPDWAAHGHLAAAVELVRELVRGAPDRRAHRRGARARRPDAGDRGARSRPPAAATRTTPSCSTATSTSSRR